MLIYVDTGQYVAKLVVWPKSCAKAHITSKLPGNFLKNYMLMQRSVLGQEYRIFCNSWQAGFWELLHVHIEVGSDRRLRIIIRFTVKKSTAAKTAAAL